METTEIDFKGCLTWIIGILFVIFFLFGPAFECQAKTSGMGFPHRWGPLMGCQIEVNPGQWIPLDSYYFKQE